MASAQRSLLVLLLASLALVAWVFKPLAVALFLAAVLGGALWPIYHRICVGLRHSPRIAGTLVTVGVVVVIVGPLFLLSFFVVKEASEGVRFITETLREGGIEGLVSKLPDRFERLARQVMDRLPVTPREGLDSAVQEQVSARGGKAVAAVGAVLAGTGALLFQAAMMLIALYVFLTNKEKILAWIDDASPLASGQTRELLAEFRRVSVAVVRSVVLTAAVQALVALVGYYLARVPYALFFAALTFFIAMIPAVGAASVCLFAALLLLITGHPIAAAFLTGWGVLVVGLSDNVVKPLLIRHDVSMHGAVVFFALLGGLAAFGTVGLLLGPLAVALFIAMLRIYKRDYGAGGEAPPASAMPPPSVPPSGSPVTSDPRSAGRLVPGETFRGVTG